MKNADKQERTAKSGESKAPPEELDRVLAMLQADPLCKGPMPPDHPAALKPGHSLVIFFSKKPKKP